ncbi:SAM-dependent methyltransferase [Actinomadura livida]|uniref:SAM-dependent methyltransferase n=1 Tax=Actinomadura livida TaxID=79909 RepID=A0A7W7IF55_9ACTN|nr:MULTISPECIES: SAM-dependent methyltransferase [Actinomadura]MBB4775952.1 SAM-dependent methyltransferase [Actinomadura catellatispora]GGU16545.1 methyltransferase type 12 [Actinomadura livida]
MIGELYERALAGRAGVEVEDGTGRRSALPVQEWMALRPGDEGVLDRCDGPTLDVGSGPGRLTVALTERGILALGIDTAPYAVELTVAAGGPALCRDVFGRVPGAGIWTTLLLVDGNIGIGGAPSALLARAFALLAPGGRVLAEVRAPGTGAYSGPVRLRSGQAVGEWFPWAWVSADDIAGIAWESGAAVKEIWEEAGRWFVALSR